MDPVVVTPLPEGDLPIRAVSASRADLVRYAAATGDFNPIHWDPAAAHAAGLPGVIVHGLLMLSWIAAAAARHGTGPAPLQSLRARFRRPLRPGTAAAIAGTVEAVETGAADLTLELSHGSSTAVSAKARVTR
jgi:acyl dehydratase